jgi:hypothetical protein
MINIVYVGHSGYARATDVCLYLNGTGPGPTPAPAGQPTDQALALINQHRNARPDATLSLPHHASRTVHTFALDLSTLLSTSPLYPLGEGSR